MAQYIQVCPDTAFDAATRTCSQLEWVMDAPWPPLLSISDGLQLSGAILGCWVIGFIIRTVRGTVSPGR